MVAGGPQAHGPEPARQELGGAVAASRAGPASLQLGRGEGRDAPAELGRAGRDDARAREDGGRADQAAREQQERDRAAPDHVTHCTQSTR